MTHLSPGGGAVSPPPSTLSRQGPARPSFAHPALPHPFNGQMLLTLQIASRRARLAELEMGMIAACEAAALGTRSRTKATTKRKHWSQTT